MEEVRIIHSFEGSSSQDHDLQHRLVMIEQAQRRLAQGQTCILAHLRELLTLSAPPAKLAEITARLKAIETFTSN
jgi:hypothetical protein